MPIVVECLGCNMNQIFLFPKEDFLTVLECQSCLASGVIYEGKIIPIDNIENFSVLDKESAKEYLIDAIIKHSYKEFRKYVRKRYSSQKKTSAKEKIEKFTVNSAMSIVGRMYSKDEKGLRELEDDYFKIGIEANNLQKDQGEIPKDIQRQFEALAYLYEAFKRFVKQ